MKTVKTFSNLAEAGFATSYLEAAGIPTLLADEQTFSLGYQTGVVALRVQVEDADYERALRVLTEGLDAAAPVPATPITPPAKAGMMPTGLFIAIIGGIGVLGFASYWVRESDRAARQRTIERTYDFDNNRDGKPDTFHTYRDNHFLRSEADRNYDGEPDAWDYFDRDGIIEREEIDYNFDGKPDEWLTFRDGVTATARTDTDFDGRPDQFTRYKNGIAVETNVRPGDSAIVVRKLIYTHGVPTEQWTDENADGTFDSKILIDPFGARSERIPMPPL